MYPDGESKTIYEFADFRLIPGEGLLLQNGVPIDLNPKAFAMLTLLVVRHGHLVSKAEMTDTIWGDSFVEEGVIPKAIWFVRNALGDTSKERFIQTVSRRGYRFVAPVIVHNDPSVGSGGSELISTGFRLPAGVDESGTFTNEYDAIVEDPQTGNGFNERAATQILAETDSLTPSRSLFRRRHLFSILAIVLLAVLGTAVYFSYPWATSTDEHGLVTIAVLPFEPINGANRDDLYDVGIADALINRLSKIENFQVRSLSSVRRYAGLETDAIAAGIEQKVKHVLVSRYQLVGGKIRVTAQLIDVGGRRIVEVYDFQRDAADLFTAQDAIALELKNRLASKFGVQEIGAPSERGTSNEDAYRYYLLAHNFNELRGPENGRKALEQIERAVELDPNFARGWAAKAYIHRYHASHGTETRQHSLMSMEAVEKALALDPDLSEAHSVRCFNKSRYEYDLAGAERACQRAIELDPNSPLAHKLYSNFLFARGRSDEAISEIKKAIDLQPVSYDNQQTYGLALYFARRYADAEAQWKQLIPLNPDHKWIYGQLVRSLVAQGKESDALEHLIKLLTLEKADQGTIERFRETFTTSGWRGVTLERIKLDESKQNPRAFELARFYATVGDKDNAFKYLERAYLERSNMIAVLEVDPELDPLRDDLRYDLLIQRIWPIR